MGLPKNTAVLPTLLSPLGKACARIDLTAVHDILLKTGYKDDEGAENEVAIFLNTLNAMDALLFLKIYQCCLMDVKYSNE